MTEVPDSFKGHNSKELLDMWREIYHEINKLCLESEIGEKLDDLHDRTCQYLVDQGVHNYDDLYWTPEHLAEARRKAEDFKKSVIWD